jgi:hypothetical protein
MADDFKVEVEKKAVSESAKLKVHEALRKTLHEQLAQETQTLGHTPGRAAIHGMTGVSSREALER